MWFEKDRNHRPKEQFVRPILCNAQTRLAQTSVLCRAGLIERYQAFDPTLDQVLAGDAAPLFHLFTEAFYAAAIAEALI